MRSVIENDVGGKLEYTLYHSATCHQCIDGIEEPAHEEDKVIGYESDA
jgi:hypothetical protein